MDPDLADEWTTVGPFRDYACTAIARAAESAKDSDHPGALRYVVGLREGWEGRRAASVAARGERAASSQDGHHAERG